MNSTRGNKSKKINIVERRSLRVKREIITGSHILIFWWATATKPKSENKKSINFKGLNAVESLNEGNLKLKGLIRVGMLVRQRGTRIKDVVTCVKRDKR